MKLLHSSIACAALVATAHAQSPTSTDLWDISQGALFTDASAVSPIAGSFAALLGETGQNTGSIMEWTFFEDGQPPNYVHYVEWEMPADVTVGLVRVFASGPNWHALGREFEQFVLKAKSPGSETYDVTVVTAAPPLASFVDWITGLVINEAIAPLTARSFRAEFTTTSSVGPHILEIDGLPEEAPPPPPAPEIPSVATDVWDISQGAVVTATSGIIPDVGSPSGLFGEGGQDISMATYFNDEQPENFVHFVEWQTPVDVTVNGVRVYAYGDADLNNGREFAQLTIKAKSPGSDTYDLTLATFEPAHPYAFIDPVNALILDQTFASVTARFFRAEFVQYTAGNGWDGPRIVEIDALMSGTPPPPPPPPTLPVITWQPESVTANLYAPAAVGVEATGTGELHYQWFKDGVALEGQTAPALMIPSLTASEVGTYHVSVTDDAGTTLSADAAVNLDLVNILPSPFDLWDVRTGTTVGAHSEIADGSELEGMFGGDVTEFESNRRKLVHFVEWETETPVLVKTVRLFAHGDGRASANLHEFSSITLKAKSRGSRKFDIVVGTFIPSHPYLMLDANTFAILDAKIAPIKASAFRAEFTTFNGGPRILELDAFGTRPLVTPGVVIAPKSQNVPRNGCAILSVVAKGGNLKYQWKFNGQKIRGETSDALKLGSVKKQDQGNYTVVVSNELGSVESAPAGITVGK